MLFDGTYEVSEGTATKVNKIVIPATYKGKAVTTIGKKAFSSCGSLKSIVIPNSIRRIDDYAFIHCCIFEVINHSSLNITAGADGYGGIADDAIEVHTGESKIVNRDGYIFYTYNGVNYLVEYVGENTELVLPENYNEENYEIYHNAFSNCNRLTSITIPDSVIHIGDRAFYNCSSLKNITVGEKNTKYHSAGNCLIETESKTLILGCLKSIIPTDGSVISIGEAAFYCCSNLKSIVIPDSVTSIGSSAFYFCDSLTSITIPNGVTSIGESAFEECYSLTSITIGNGVMSIGYRALAYCDSLTSITIPDSVTSIGSSAFYSCDSLTSITIPNGVTSIGNGVFADCSSLTSIKIPNSVTSIGNGVFNGCSSLTSVTIGNGVTSIGDDVFNDCSSLTSVTIGNGVTSIGDDVFNGCSNLTSITIPDSVTSIGDDVFNDCSSLTSVTIGNGVTRIGDNAFDGCSNLTSITVGEDNTKYHSAGNCLIATARKTLILGCKNSVIPIDGSVTSIGEDAFYNCSSLTSITIPDSVTSIGEYAFYNCGSLTDIYFTGTESEWNAIDKSSANISSSVTIHYNYVPSNS